MELSRAVHLDVVEHGRPGLRLELSGEPPPGSLLHHSALLGCWGSLANPPRPRGKSTISAHNVTDHYHATVRATLDQRVAADSGATADGLRLGSTKGDAPVSDRGAGNRWNSRPVDSSRLTLASARRHAPPARLRPRRWLPRSLAGHDYLRQRTMACLTAEQLAPRSRESTLSLVEIARRLKHRRVAPHASNLDAVSRPTRSVLHRPQRPSGARFSSDPQNRQILCRSLIRNGPSIRRRSSRPPQKAYWSRRRTSILQDLRLSTSIGHSRG